VKPGRTGEGEGEGEGEVKGAREEQGRRGRRGIMPMSELMETALNFQVVCAFFSDSMSRDPRCRSVKYAKCVTHPTDLRSHLPAQREILLTRPTMASSSAVILCPLVVARIMSFPR
jgi:hypothetical protein